MSSIPSKSRQKRKKKNKDIPEQTSRFYRPLFLSLSFFSNAQPKKKRKKEEQNGKSPCSLKSSA
jgi:hypothetical protein